MAKRLTGTNKWDKAWFRMLSPRHKALWQFLCDKCDQAGMWEIDLVTASHFINDITPITENDFVVFGDRVERYSQDKLWIVDFVDFQCGELSHKSPAHKPVFKLLIKYNLLDRVQGRLPSRLLEIELEKEIKKEEEKEKEITPIPAEAIALQEKVSEYFAVKPILRSNLYTSICDFIETVTHRHELQMLTVALEKYKAYKARSQEARHNVTAWIGSKENHYNDGQWIMVDWELKLNNLIKNEPVKATSPAASAVLSGGKPFGNLRAHPANPRGNG